MIDHLPRNSHFTDALANDIDFARVVIEANPETEGNGARISAWSPEVEMLAQAVDALRAVNANQIVIAGGKAKFSPVVRPITAFDRARHEAKRAKQDFIRGRVEEARRLAREQQQPN